MMLVVLKAATFFRGAVELASSHKKGAKPLILARTELEPTSVPTIGYFSGPLPLSEGSRSHSRLPKFTFQYENHHCCSIPAMSKNLHMLWLE